MAASPPKPDTSAGSQAGPADPLDGILKAAAVQSAALVLLSAAQHVQRTTLLVEAATARMLARALSSGTGAQGGEDGDLTAVRAALAEAMGLFNAAQDQARALTSKRGQGRD